MIYEYPDKNQPIRQGDIFYPLPLMLLDLNKLLAISDNGTFEETSWDLIKDKKNIVVNAPLKPVWGIVATQDCDANRSPLISVFQIGTLNEIARLNPPSTPKKWASLITTKSRLYAKWFYLPSDQAIGFEERMAINFIVIFHILRENLEQNVEKLRKGRLNKIAYQHYRENIAQFFRRYPYDEWYPLTNEEFLEYNNEKGPVNPFEWQE